MSTIAENVSLRMKWRMALIFLEFPLPAIFLDFIFNQNIPKYTAIFVDSFTCMVILARSIDLSKKGLKSIGAHFQHQITSLESMS